MKHRLATGIAKRKTHACVMAYATILALAYSDRAMAADIAFVPSSGGVWNWYPNWDLGRVPAAYDDVSIIAGTTANKAVTYDWTGTSNFSSVNVQGSVSTYGAIWQLANVLQTETMKVGGQGEAWHWMEGPAYLWVTDDLYVGHSGSGVGHFYLATSGSGSGVHVDSNIFAGYGATGDFDHTAGEVECSHLFVGQNAPGLYQLDGSLTTSTINAVYYTVIGNADTGVFEQAGGTHTTPSVIIGLNSGGFGTYSLEDGLLDADHMTLGFNGDGLFEQTGGAVEIAQYLLIGGDGTHPAPVEYSISGNATLDVAGDIRVGSASPGIYSQYGGTVTVGDSLEIQNGTPGSLGDGEATVAGGTLTVADAFHNAAGYYHQTGGLVKAGSITNSSAEGMVIETSAELQSRNFQNSGVLEMYGNALLRGPLAMPPSIYWRCALVNDGEFQMGAAGLDGGTFRGTLTNNGTFVYYAGDFSNSVLINNGGFDNRAGFSCTYIENHATIGLASTRPLTVSGGGYSASIENHGTITAAAGTDIELGEDKPLVNYGILSAGGSYVSRTIIYGDVENYGYVVPSAGTPSANLRIEGDFTADRTAELHVRLYGTDEVSEYDVLDVGGTATLDGTLSVQLGKWYVPEIGDSYGVVSCNSRIGEFAMLELPNLPANRRWSARYLQRGVVLDVLAQPGDCNEDGAIDLTDLADMVDCLSGPAQNADSACQCFDLVYDGHVDLADFQAFQELYAGS